MSIRPSSMVLAAAVIMVVGCTSDEGDDRASTQTTTSTGPATTTLTTAGGTTTTELPKYPVRESGPPGATTGALLTRLGCTGFAPRVASDYVYYRDEPVPMEAELCGGPGEDRFTIRVYRAPEEIALAVSLHPEFYCGRAVRVSADNWIVVADSAASAGRVVKKLGGTIIDDCP